MLKTYTRTLPLVLAALVALRALVPVGYMLMLPGDGSFELALHLCPTQNRGIDLSRFEALDGPAPQHHGHTDDGSDEPSGTTAAAGISTECNAWLSSAALAVAANPLILDLYTTPAISPPRFGAELTAWWRLHPSQPRAPPHLSA